MDKPFRVGRISAVYPERCTAKVYFEDVDVTSRELPILVRGSQNTKDFWIPATGESVVCIFISDRSRVGFILGTYFNDEDQPPVKDKSKRHLKYEDGTTIEYDVKTHTLVIDCIGTVNIKATGNINVIGDVLADGISLKNHTHTTVNGETSTPH